MSLISESLKKAQLEAMRQDEQQRRSYFGSGRLDVPRERRPIVAIAIAGIGGALIAGAAFFFASQRESGEAAPAPVRTTAVAPLVQTAPVTETITAPVVAPPATAPPATAPPAVAAPQQATAAVPPRIETRAPKSEPVAKPAEAGASAPEPKAARVREERESPAASVAAAEEKPAEEKKPAVEKKASARERDRLVDGKSHVSPISAPGGMEISLSGVSSIGGKSVAIINGSVVREGSAVGPFVVEAIERGRVRLRYIDVRIWVTY